jgi:hypothetical protein
MQLRLLARAVRAQSDEDSVALEEVQGVLDVRDIRAVVKGRVHEDFVETAKLLCGAGQKVGAKTFAVGQKAGG